MFEDFKDLELTSDDRQTLNNIHAKLVKKYDLLMASLASDRFLIYLSGNIAQIFGTEKEEVIKNYFQAKPDFWLPSVYIENETEAKTVAKNYELKKMVSINLEQATSRKFGLSQVDLKLGATLYDTGNNKVDNRIEVNQSLVGRPVKDEQILKSLQQMLAELEKKLP